MRKRFFGVATLSIEQVSDRIESIPNKQIQYVAKFQLITACRISEAVGKYAVTKNDLQYTEYKGQTLALFTLKTAKREGVERIVALPVKSKWVYDIAGLFHSSKKKVFRYSIRSIQTYFHEAFGDLTYQIERYSTGKKVSKKVVGRHMKPVSTHALRHLRLSELTNRYGFNDFDLAIFAGWKLKGMAGRYVTGQWGRYVDKLL